MGRTRRWSEGPHQEKQGGTLKSKGGRWFKVNLLEDVTRGRDEGLALDTGHMIKRNYIK